MFDLLFFVAAC